MSLLARYGDILQPVLTLIFNGVRSFLRFWVLWNG
jgi:hypothetical protein